MRCVTLALVASMIRPLAQMRLTMSAWVMSGRAGFDLALGTEIR
jgi:hypothetical protein